MARVLVTGPLPPGAMAVLRGWADVDASGPGRWRTRLAGHEGLLSFITDPIDDDVLATPGLRMVANFGVGFDNVDLGAAARRGILVSNTPAPELTETTADLALALVLGVARRLVEGDRMVRTGRWTGWRPDQLLGREVHGATLGIVGPGRIGRAVAHRALGFGMDVLIHGRRRDPALAKDLGSRSVGLEELLRTSDFVSLHVPLTSATHHMISAAQLELMKPTAYLVNTSRGPIVAEADLVRALRRGTIAGAGMDVYEFEPRVAPALRRMANVLLLPHLGSATHGTREAMGRMAVENLRLGLSGGTPPNLVGGP